MSARAHAGQRSFVRAGDRPIAAVRLVKFDAEQAVARSRTYFRLCVGATMALAPEQFVKGLATYCRDAAVADCVAGYTVPPGRSPAHRALTMSAWFKALSPDDRQMVIAAMTDVAHGTLFGVLCALDGARTIDDQKHTFVVMSELRGVRESISSPAIDLHDLLSQPGPP